MEGGWSYKKLIIFLFSASFFLHTHNVDAEDPYSFLMQDCSNSANYATDSEYATNLNLLLRSLSSNGTRDGFFEDSVGSSPDTVYGLVQCRGDISTQDCQTCLNTSTVAILQKCPNRMSASLRYEYCTLRYSNIPFSGEADRVFRYLVNLNNISDADVDHFEQQLGSLMNNLSATAVSRQSRYDSGSIDYTSFSDIYGLVQCTKDLSPTNCASCLQNAISGITGCCSRHPGARIYSRTCFVRYELYSFFQGQPQSPPPHSSANRRKEENGNGKNKSTNIVAIVAPVIGGSVLLLAICAFIVIRRTRKNWSKRKPQVGDDIRSDASLQPDLNITRKGTNDISDADKLGEGGFGAVYKGELVDGKEVVKDPSRNP